MSNGEINPKRKMEKIFLSSPVLHQKNQVIHSQDKSSRALANAAGVGFSPPIICAIVCTLSSEFSGRINVRAAPVDPETLSL
jgi:hypothetical protein